MGKIIRKVTPKVVAAPRAAVIAQREMSQVLGSRRNFYRPMIRSRHPSHAPLREVMERLPFRSVIRMGSTTELEDVFTANGTRVELNSADAIRNSSSKIKMKECFTEANVNTASWIRASTPEAIIEGMSQFSESGEISYPIVAKHAYGSRGTGNTLLKSELEIREWCVGKNLESHVFEKFYNFNKEYRLHVTKNGCFYACRKMLKSEFKDHPNAWQRHDDNCVWILQENENFDKPSNWDQIVEHCVKALVSCGLDFGACDLRVQNSHTSEGIIRENCEFIVVEINSAPSFGDVTLEKYKNELRNLLIDKYNER
tara:strand:+ start:248 stop:1186 length:939 start_codon:yes stop_codon:yes gene_type:complete